MIHYPHNDITKIDTPHVTIYRDSPSPWFIDSDYAKAKNGIDQIQFWSHVNIHHPADSDNPNTLMTTDLLNIFPEDEIASTDRPITFVQPDTKINAIGMLANLNDGTIKLLSQAKGEYAPSS
jgi:lipopolysaccharide export system protein LptC